MSSSVAVAHLYDARTSRQTTSNSASSRGPSADRVWFAPAGPQHLVVERGRQVQMQAAVVFGVQVAELGAALKRFRRTLGGVRPEVKTPSRTER